MPLLRKEFPQSTRRIKQQRNRLLGLGALVLSLALASLVRHLVGGVVMEVYAVLSRPFWPSPSQGQWVPAGGRGGQDGAAHPAGEGKPAPQGVDWLAVGATGQQLEGAGDCPQSSGVVAATHPWAVAVATAFVWVMRWWHQGA